MDFVKVWHLSHTISCLCKILNSFNAVSLFHIRIVMYCTMVAELSKKQLSWQFMKLHSTVFERVQLHPDQNTLILGHQIILVGSQWWCQREMHQVVAPWCASCINARHKRVSAFLPPFWECFTLFSLCFSLNLSIKNNFVSIRGKNVLNSVLFIYPSILVCVSTSGSCCCWSYFKKVFTVVKFFKFFKTIWLQFFVNFKVFVLSKICYSVYLCI